AAAGVSIRDAAPGQPAPSAGSSQPVPPTLLAAAAEPARDGSPVRLAVEGDDVIAVSGDEGGDPREWCAVARRDEHGNLFVFVSAELDSRQQRAAVLEAVRASRRAGWRAALPLWIGLAAGLRFWLRRLQSAIRTQPAAFATGIGAIVAGAVVAGVLLTAPGSHSPLASGGSP